MPKRPGSPLYSVPDNDGSRGCATDEVAALRAEVGQLRQAMVSRATIEQAKGMVMLRYGLSADDGFMLLRRWSAQHQLKLRTIAEMLVRVGVTYHRVVDDYAMEDMLSEAVRAVQPGSKAGNPTMTTTSPWTALSP